MIVVVVGWPRRYSDGGGSILVEFLQHQVFTRRLASPYPLPGTSCRPSTRPSVWPLPSSLSPLLVTQDQVAAHPGLVAAVSQFPALPFPPLLAVLTCSPDTARVTWDGGA